MIRLSTIALMATMLTTASMAEADIKLGGQGVLYYQTNDLGETDLFSQENSSANAGLELSLKADAGNGFNLEYQETFLGTLGLENRIVSGIRQNAHKDDLNSHAMTRFYVSKKIENTLIKLGRQELPKHLSPLAFSENWNVFKNSFDAIVVVNKDIIDTTIVGAYVSGSNHHNNLSKFDNLSANSLSLGAGAGTIDSGAYMLTVQNESFKNVPITASYYALKDIAGLESGNALWLDFKSNQAPVKLALQAGQIDPANDLDKTTAFGVKASGRVENIGLSLAYSSVNDGDVSIQNVGTGVKTPLYTQMIGNQDFISRDADAVVLKAVAKLPVGKVIAQYNMTTDNSDAKNDYNEFDLIYKFKAFDTKMFLAYIGQSTDKKTFAGGTEDSANTVRFWSRYNF
jgi:hypothetical protein